MAMVHNTAMVHTMPSRIHSRERPQEREFEALLVDLFVEPAGAYRNGNLPTGRPT